LSGKRQYDIAGLALSLSGRHVESVSDPHEEARKVLRLTMSAARSLFVVSGGPEDLQREYVTEPMNAGEYRHNAKLAVRRLRET
jgi:hypothetical protein